ncbi:hypothetical protein C1645_762048 [Glomus cerebriforme]|uniref:Cysteine protease n=1 Tax=Glomus cerebriforme TaxID=658196 RepID=A0A397T8B1_9GLOM|nr:hypothetical protein C1645_762048 [Glomus cerebriforme]
MSPIQPNNNTTPAIKIFTPPSSPTMATTGQTEEWDSVDDFSVDSLPAEESSSSTAQSPFTPGSPPEEINGDEIINEYDIPKNSSAEILQKVGHWFYNTRLVQYMKSDERSRVKHNYSTNSIWMLGVEYKFTEDGGTVNLPKSDRGEHARGGRASSLLNYMFGSSEEDEDYNEVLQSTHERHHSDDFIRTHKLNKSRSFSQAPYDNDFQQQQQQQLGLFLLPKGKSNSPPGVIRRLRSLSLSRKSPSPDQRSQTPESSPPKNESRIFSSSLSPVKRIRPLSYNRKQDLSDSLNYEVRSSTSSHLQKDMLSESQTSKSDQSRRLSMGPNFLRKYSSNDNQESLDKKPRRKTFSIFSGREKPKYSSSSPSPRLYPHLEIEADHDSKYSHDDSKLKRISFGDTDVCYSSEDEKEDENEINCNSNDTISRPSEEMDVGVLSGDNISIETVTRESMNSSDYLGVSISKKSLSKDNEVSNDAQKERSVMSIQTDTGSIKSSGSVRSLPPTPTSLYRPDSLGPLNPNQQKLMDFLLDFQSRIFCCYRKEFPPIEPAFHTTDTGWGCMHRTGQSLLAQGFLWVLLGRDWRLHNTQTESDILIYRKILRWFMDGPEPEQYYSIHNIARVGISLDKKIGDWFGPATVAHALKRLSLTHKECPLAIYVPTDNTIYRSDMVYAATGEHDFSDQKPWKPILILLSVRLGTDKLNPSYSDNLKTLFTFPQFLGIAGGRPGRSLYFVATQDDDLLYLDPHFVRPAINLNKVTEFPIEDYHSTIVRAMDISEMDPSMLLGFLCQSSQDFDNLCDRVHRDINSQFSLFTILNACPIPGSWPRKKSLSDISFSDRSVSDKSPSIIIETVDDVDEVDDDDIEDLKGIVIHEEDEEEEVISKQEIDDINNKNETNNNNNNRSTPVDGENFELL